MAFAIGDACIGCGACADSCAMECIFPTDEGYQIDAEKCIDCGACADNCPIDAIQPAD